MKINKLHLQSFGMHHKLELNFSENISLVVGENEVGKSTVKAAIECLLYGFGKRHGRYAYKPWNGTPVSLLAEGHLKEGESFHLSRELKKIPEGYLNLAHKTIEIGNEELFFSSHLNEKLYGQLYSLSTENSSLFQAIDFELIERRLLTTLGSADLQSTEVVLETVKEMSNQIYRFNGRGNSDIKTLRSQLNDLNESIVFGKEQRYLYGEKIKNLHNTEETYNRINCELIEMRKKEDLLKDCITIEETFNHQNLRDLEQCISHLEAFKRDGAVVIDMLNQYKFLNARLDEKTERCREREIQLGLSQGELSHEAILEQVQKAIHGISVYEAIVSEKPNLNAMTSPLMLVLGGFGFIGAFYVFQLNDIGYALAIGMLSGISFVMGAVLLHRNRHSRNRIKLEMDHLQETLNPFSMSRKESLEVLKAFKTILIELEALLCEKMALKSQLGIQEQTLRKLVLALETTDVFNQESLTKRPFDFWMPHLNETLTSVTNKLYGYNQDKLMHLEWLKLIKLFEIKHQISYEEVCVQLIGTAGCDNRIQWFRQEYEQCLTILEKNELKKQQHAIELATLKKEIELAALPDLAELEEKKGELKNQLELKMEERDRLTILYGFIKKQDTLFREKRQPEVLKKAGYYLSTITNHKWNRIGLGEDQALMVWGINGVESVQRITSTGMREQIYLALKLALMDSIEEDREPLPLILDEPFSNWDHLRRAALVQLIYDVSQKRQVIILSCHQETIDLFDQGRYSIVNMS